MKQLSATKILFVHHGKGLGGAPLSLLYLIQQLDPKQYDCTVVFLHESEVIKLYQDAGIKTLGPTKTYDFPHTKIWWLRWYHLPMIMRCFFDLIKTWFFIAPKIYSAVNPDIIHLNTSSLSGWALAAQKYNIPVVWHIREPLADGYFGIRKLLTQKIVGTLATKIIGISHHDAEPWKPLKKTHVVENFAPAHRYKLTDEHYYPIIPTILYVGGMSEEKGIITILQVMKKLILHLPDAQLIIAGHMPFAKQNSFRKTNKTAATAWQMIHDLGKACTVVGLVHDIPKLMAESTVIVFPATVGHFARPIIEAGMMKRPVIASDLAPLDELVINKTTGFLVSASDYDAWVDTLLYVLKNKTTAQQIGQNAYTHCVKAFNADTQVRKISLIYDQVLFKEKEK